MAEWIECTIGDLCDTISDTYKGNDENVILVNTSDVLEGKVLNHTQVPNKNLKGQFKKTFRKNDILFSEIRPANKRFAFIDFEDTSNYIASTKLMVLRHNEKVIPEYLYAILKSNYILAELQHLAETRSGTFPQITFTSELAPMKVNLPDKKTQKQIVSILSSIEQKMDSNETINNNLEQQAQAIFKAWFVDFEPFGGELPNDWKHTKLGTSCNCVLGGTPSRNKIEYWNGTIPWINSGEVNKFRIIKPSETITNLGLEKSATKLLPTKTTVLAITGATLGQVSLLEIDACANQSVVGIIPNDNLPYEYIYPLIKQNIAELVSNQTGGAQQHINKQNVENLDIVIPAYTHLMQYQNTVCGIYEMIANNCFENDRLSSVRDTLLPKLMSGEIDVSAVQL